MIDAATAVTLRLSHDAAAPCDGRHWFGPLTAEDRSVLVRARPPVLDIGCGPGRHVIALAEAGKVALGIDLTASVVAVARRRGASVLHRCVFAPVPGAGRWSTALLLDGNIGIGGDPAELLRRVSALLARDGSALVELDPPSCTSEPTNARLELDGVAGPWFAWAQLSVDDLPAVARAAAMRIVEVWTGNGRWFADLRPEPEVLR